MTTKEIIKKIYDEVIGVVLRNIKEEKDEVGANYLDYLNTLYYYKIDKSKDREKELEKILLMEKRTWNYRDVNARLKMFTIDKSMVTITKISDYGFELASRRFKENSKPNISFEDANKNIEMLSNELKNVWEDNKYMAQQLISEGILDFEYACGKNNDIISLRLYDYVQEIIESDKNNK